MDTTPSPDPQRPEFKKEKIQFKPITSGLGFHADTRPYAPMVKRSPLTKSFGTSSHHSISGTLGASGSASAESALLRSKLAIRTASVLSQGAQPRASTLVKEEAFAKPHYSLLYSLKRVLAYGLDCIFNLSLFIGAVILVLWRVDIQPWILLSGELALITALFLFTFTWALTAAQEIAFGTSLGKRSFGLTLQGSGAALFLRAFFFAFSLIFFGLGILWALIDRQRRCWHDLFINVQPTEIAKL